MLKISTILKSAISIALLNLFIISCTSTEQPAQASSASTQNQTDHVKMIYVMERQIRVAGNKISDLRKETDQASQDNKFELVHELKEKIEKAELELKDFKIKLEDELIAYKQNWEKRSWWQKVAFEAGLQYIHFSNDLSLDDSIGLRVKIHRVKQELRPFHIGSYLYYPVETDSAYPLKQVEASRFFFEYRHFKSETNSSTQKNVEVNYYLIGFGLLGQTLKDTYIKVNLAGGLQRYTGTQPSDTGPVIAYTLGLNQKLSPQLGIELDLTEEILWSKASQGGTHALLNFSVAFTIRYSF